MAYTALSSGTLTGNGDHLICSLIFLYPSLCALREIGLQNMESQLHFAQTHQHLIPDQFHWEVSTSTVGVGALYHGGVPVIQRTRGLPYQQTEQHCVAIGWGWGWWVGGVCVCVGGGFREDILAGRMFARATKSAHAQAPMGDTPSTMVGKKNPDRDICLDERRIPDLRRVNLPCPTDQYYKVDAPSVGEIAHTIIQLQARNPPAPIPHTKRGIESAFRPLRLRPDFWLVAGAALPGGIFGV